MCGGEEDKWRGGKERIKDERSKGGGGEEDSRGGEDERVRGRVGEEEEW